MPTVKIVLGIVAAVMTVISFITGDKTSAAIYFLGVIAVFA